MAPAAERGATTGAGGYGRERPDAPFPNGVSRTAGLFSLVTLLNTRLSSGDCLAVLTTAWPRKQRPTFSDILSGVRQQVWREQGLIMSRYTNEIAKCRMDDGLRQAMPDAAFAT